MLRRTLLILLAITLSPALLAADFRNASWNDTPNQVKATETAHLVREETDNLFYKDRLAGIKVIINYTFLNGKLVECTYMADETYTNKNQYIRDINTLNELLTKKYGAPVKHEQFWRDDRYKNDPQKHGFAVSIGHLVYRTEWQTPDSIIVSGLRGQNFDVISGIVYRHNASNEQLEAHREQQTLDQL